MPKITNLKELLSSALNITAQFKPDKKEVQGPKQQVREEEPDLSIFKKDDERKPITKEDFEKKTSLILAKENDNEIIQEETEKMWNILNVDSDMGISAQEFENSIKYLGEDRDNDGENDTLTAENLTRDLTADKFKNYITSVINHDNSVPKSVMNAILNDSSIKEMMSGGKQINDYLVNEIANDTLEKMGISDEEKNMLNKSGLVELSQDGSIKTKNENHSMITDSEGALFVVDENLQILAGIGLSEEKLKNSGFEDFSLNLERMKKLNLELDEDAKFNCINGIIAAPSSDDCDLIFDKEGTVVSANIKDLGSMPINNYISYLYAQNKIDKAANLINSHTLQELQPDSKGKVSYTFANLKDSEGNPYTRTFSGKYATEFTMAIAQDFGIDFNGLSELTKNKSPYDVDIKTLKQYALNHNADITQTKPPFIVVTAEGERGDKNVHSGVCIGTVEKDGKTYYRVVEGNSALNNNGIYIREYLAETTSDKHIIAAIDSSPLNDYEFAQDIYTQSQINNQPEKTQTDTPKDIEQATTNTPQGEIETDENTPIGNIQDTTAQVTQEDTVNDTTEENEETNPETTNIPADITTLARNMTDTLNSPTKDAQGKIILGSEDVSKLNNTQSAIAMAKFLYGENLAQEFAQAKSMNDFKNMKSLTMGDEKLINVGDMVKVRKGDKNIPGMVVGKDSEGNPIVVTGNNGKFTTETMKVWKGSKNASYITGVWELSKTAPNNSNNNIITDTSITPESIPDCISYMDPVTGGMMMYIVKTPEDKKILADLYNFSSGSEKDSQEFIQSCESLSEYNIKTMFALFKNNSNIELDKFIQDNPNLDDKTKKEIINHFKKTFEDKYGYDEYLTIEDSQVNNEYYISNKHYQVSYLGDFVTIIDENNKTTTLNLNKITQNFPLERATALKSLLQRLPAEVLMDIAVEDQLTSNALDGARGMYSSENYIGIANEIDFYNPYALVHETGHALDFMFKRRNNNTSSFTENQNYVKAYEQEVKKFEADGNIRYGETWNNRQNTYGDTVGNVKDYATWKPTEMFAECYALLMTGDCPSKDTILKYFPQTLQNVRIQLGLIRSSELSTRNKDYDASRFG